MTTSVTEEVHSQSNNQQGYWSDASRNEASIQSWQQLEQAFLLRNSIHQQLNHPNLSTQQKAYFESQMAESNRVLGYYWMMLNSASQHENQAKLWQQRYSNLLNELNHLKAASGYTRKNPIQAAYGLSNSQYFNQVEETGSITKAEFKELVNRMRGLSDSPNSIQGYLSKALDYLLRDRLPKLFSTRLWLVLGGSSVIYQYGGSISSQNRILLIVALILAYVGSEAVLKKKKSG